MGKLLQRHEGMQRQEFKEENCSLFLTLTYKNYNIDDVPHEIFKCMHYGMTKPI